MEIMGNKNIVQNNENLVKEFRLNAKQLFLTYSQTNLDLKQILAKLEEKISMEEYVLGYHKHKDDNLHIHCYVKLKTRLDIRNSNFFDIVDCENKIFHPNIESVKSKSKSLEYILKTSISHITNMDLNGEHKVKTSLEKASEISLSKGIQCGMNYLLEKDAGMTIRNYTNLKRNLSAYVKDQKRSNIKVDDLNSFVDCKEIRQAKDWLVNRSDKKVLCLYGETEVGKSSFAMSLLQDLNPLLVSNLEAFKKFSEENKAIIFDDFPWHSLLEEVRIHLLDQKFEYTIPIKFSSFTIPVGTIKVITCNDLKKAGLFVYSPTERTPISRRLELLEIKKKLYLSSDEEEKIEETETCSKEEKDLVIHRMKLENRMWKLRYETLEKNYKDLETKYKDLETKYKEIKND